VQKVIKKYQIDAFTSTLFRGNPAAVCVLDKWLEDILLQQIATEHNLSETAFIIPKNDQYEIRWFTPTMEVKLCGHATLASAYVINKYIDTETKEITFSSLSGPLKVKLQEENLLMRFPIQKPTDTEYRTLFMNCFNHTPTNVYKGGEFFIFEYETEEDIKTLKPDLSLIRLMDNAIGIIATAKGKQTDYVCRLFAPAAGINEDPATGSIQTSLAPFWAERLNKNEMSVSQLSKRGGDIIVKLDGHYVLIGGKVKLYSEGNIYIS